MKTQQMLKSHPNPASYQEALTACIDACFECAQCCTACADACLGEKEKVEEMRCCIRTDLDCADICTATGTALSRQTKSNPELLRALVEACRTACRVCGEDCRSHGDKYEHCRICGECCQQCEQACEKLLGVLG